MESVRKPVFDAAGDVLPVLWIGEPIRPVGGKGPGADMGNAVGERIDIAVGAIGERDLVGEPVRLDRAVALQEA